MNKKILFSVVAAALSALVYYFLPADCPEPARRTAAVFVFAALFWSLEIIPLFATSLLAVVFLIFSMTEPASALTPNPVLMLFLGGFVLARVLHKYGVDHALVEHLMKLFGQKPYFVLLGFILATGFISLWMSHTAATALMLAIIAPVLSRLEADDIFKKALVLAIPFSANIGGIGTPVGTPPNAIAIGILAQEGIRVDFLRWMVMAVPLALILLFITSFILYFMFPPKYKKLSLTWDIREKLTPRARWAAAISVLTILLWLTSGWHKIPEAVTALLSVALFASLGFLKREDLNGIHWDILILMWGGLALGKAMEISGLGQWIVSLPLFSHEGFWLVAVFCLLTILVSIFVSNTPTANLMVPLAMSIPGQDKLLLAVVVALSCSFDMLLPISTPSNALAFSTHVISTKDMLKSGACIVMIAIAFLLLGYPYFISRVLHTS